MELDCREFAPEPIVKQDKGLKVPECHRHYYLHANETFIQEEKKIPSMGTENGMIL